jgi:hypothetical protein
MPSFLEDRPARPASELKGPRVYSTDLHPSLFDTTAPDLSVERSAQALKIKIITKGIVTLNCAHLITPMAVKLLDRHPDLLNGDAILPAFRVGKANLRDLCDMSEAEFRASGIAEKKLDDYVTMLEGNIKTVMPWELGDIAERFRITVLTGLRSDTSLVSQRLDSIGYRSADRAKIINDIEKLDLSEDVTLRRYVEQLPINVQLILKRYISACYHIVGTGVVRCEAGTDLSPLSHFKAADVVLASSDANPVQLSDEGIFLRAFMGHALDTVQAMMLPTQIIDAMTFTDAHALSAALRDQGFQQKYEAILEKCAETLRSENPIEALDRLDPDAIGEIAKQIAGEFQRYIDSEISKYKPSEHSINVADGYRAGTDLLLDGLAAIPVFGQIVSAVQALGHAGAAATAGWSSYRTQSTARALETARLRREDEIKEAIRGLSTNESKKSQLLNAAAALADIYQIRVRRA